MAKKRPQKRSAARKRPGKRIEKEAPKPSGKPAGKAARKPQKAQRPAKPSRDPGSDTNADSKMVNALESDPEFFKDPLIGKQLGKCKIEKLIGEGRTSVVYRALYEPLKRTVALKVLQQEMTKYPAVVRVFQQEGRAVAALDHENVLKIYDVGQDGDHYYLVLELLRGKELLELIDKGEDGRLDPESALDLVRQAARGLAAAHRKNLVHRDIKPQNLVVEPGRKLKIVDFGLAAEAEGAFSGGRLGTPHYMAPEQCRGEQARTASDIYALGITLFHMLVGHPPYAGAKTTDEIIERHLEGKRLEPEKLVPGLPRPVADLVRKMTRMDPDGRPAAQEIHELIADGLLQGAGGGARTRGRRSRRGAAAASASSGPPVAVIVGGVLVLAVVLFLALGGKGDEDGPKKQQQKAKQPEKPSRKIGEPDKKPQPKTPGADDAMLVKGLEPKLASDLQELLASARREELTRNLDEALHIYDRIRKKAPEGSAFRKLGESSYQEVRKRIRDVNRGKGRKSSFISARRSQMAGETFDGERTELFAKAISWRTADAIARAKELREKTRKDTPERLRIDDALKKLSYIESLLSIVETRGESIEGPAARWSEYDVMADGALVVSALGPAGVELRDENTDLKTIRPWDDLPLELKIRLFDAVRNEKSASETMWLGYFCQLHGDARSAQYYDYALMLDNGPSMRKDVRYLKDDAKIAAAAAAKAKPKTPGDGGGDSAPQDAGASKPEGAEGADGADKDANAPAGSDGEN